MRPDDLDWESIRAGTIPWHPDGFAEVSAEHARLLGTPHDDWNRGLLPATIPTEAADRLGLPRLHCVDSIQCQVARFLAHRYAGAPATIILSHVKRYVMIQEFLVSHADRLRLDGLLHRRRRVAEEWCSPALIRVLTVVRYEARAAGRPGANARLFNYGRVARAAKRLLADPGGEPV